MVRSDALNLLTARACDSAGPGTVLRDGGGLFLEVTPAGKKFWRFRYTRPNASQRPPAKRRNRLSIGEFPNPVSLSDARACRDTYRSDLAQGIDPMNKRRDEAAKSAIAQENLLCTLADTWFAKQNWSAHHLEEWKRTLQRNVFDQVIERRPLG